MIAEGRLLQSRKIAIYWHYCYGWTDFYKIENAECWCIL